MTPDLRALKEVVRRARLYKKIAPAGSGVQMLHLIHVEVTFSLSDADIERELEAALASHGHREVDLERQIDVLRDMHKAAAQEIQRLTASRGDGGPQVAVAGQLDRSLADFERACLVHLDEEQQRANPDNALIAILCDAVRLGREYATRPCGDGGPDLRAQQTENPCPLCCRSHEEDCDLAFSRCTCKQRFSPAQEPSV